MRNINAAFVISLSLGLLLTSCSSGQGPYSPIVTPAGQEKATLAPIPVHPTPTLNSTPDENSAFLLTLGEVVNRQGWRSAIPAFSSDGKMIALVSQKASLWNVETNELIHELVRPYSNCYTRNVVFGSNGKLLATSIYCSYDASATGHVLIWNTESGALLRDWEQALSKNTSKIDGVSNSYPATGIAFLPESTVLALASGNSIEIRDVMGDRKSVVLELGDKMIASDIAISDDGKRLFAFMDFSYPKEPNEIGQKYALQTWDLESKRLVNEVKFPETGNTGFFINHFDVAMKLASKSLVSVDYIKETFSVTDIETGSKTGLYYLGNVETYVSQDARYVVYLPKLDGFNCKNQSMVLWDTHLNKNLYTFKTSNKDFGAEWCHRPHTILFNPANTIFAIAHEERVSLWEIARFTKPKENGTP